MSLTNLNLDTLRTLVTAYDLGGYGQAAKRLGRTPSAVSLQMKKLQEDVGATLFRKDGRNLGLTEIGEIVVRYGRRMLDLNDEVLDTARGASVAGSVRLGVSQDFTETILPQILSRFTKHYPLVQIEVHIDRSSALFRAIENDQLDLALCAGFSTRPSTRRLGELPLVWIAGPEFNPHREAVLPLVTFEGPCIVRQRMLELLDKAGIAWRIAMISPSLAGLWAGARAGLGVTARANYFLPQNLLVGSTLFNLPDQGNLPVVLHRRNNDLSPVAERLAEIISDLVTKTLPTGPTEMVNPLAAAVSKPARKRHSGSGVPPLGTR